MSAIDHQVLHGASAFTPEWLAGQRWFRGKSRALASVELIDAGSVEASSAWLLVLEAIDAAADRSRYLVPAVSEGGSFREPRDGDGVWATLATLMLEGGEVVGARGRWFFSPTPAASAFRPGPSAAVWSLAERRLTVEQSNTSVALGEALILKLYRLVEPGLNPEVEMNAFLTDVAFRGAPALAGSATYLLDGEPHSAAMLQELVPSTTDGWSWALERLAAAPGGLAEALDGITQIGRLTAAMHAALASRPDLPGFPSRLATAEELASWTASAQQQLDAALKVLDGERRASLAALAPRIVQRFEAIRGAAAARVSRIHGDYHLGQLLRTADGFSVIDFEGEPARTVAARRLPSSPLRDVAGMLRSLDYAGHVAATQRAGSEHPDRWLDEAWTAFLDGFGGISPDDAPLLAAFELEKACYEIVYEANNRPDWTWLPLGALERLVAGG
jgi:trehalose synthase-fused probable maltokinase